MLAAAALFFSIFFAVRTVSPPPQSAATQSSQPSQDLTARGDHAMGFSHDTTAHHFRLYRDGGAIEVSANDPKDASTRDQIRMHLAHIRAKFSQGDFNVPMFIHDTTPPGSVAMARLRSQIRYQLRNTSSGAKIRIYATNPEALGAIHDFLRFQISEHKTGDSADLSPAS